jgi:hypothetical protein
MMTFAPTEVTVAEWLATTTVAPLVSSAIFNAMPKGAPLPAVVLFQVTGGPAVAKDLPEQQARIQFDCWAAKRSEARNVALQLASELDNLQREGGVVVSGVYLAATSVPTIRWLPDPDSDTPRYILDALITTVA